MGPIVKLNEDPIPNSGDLLAVSNVIAECNKIINHHSDQKLIGLKVFFSHWTMLSLNESDNTVELYLPGLQLLSPVGERQTGFTQSPGSYDTYHVDLNSLPLLTTIVERLTSQSKLSECFITTDTTEEMTQKYFNAASRLAASQDISDICWNVKKEINYNLIGGTLQRPEEVIKDIGILINDPNDSAVIHVDLSGIENPMRMLFGAIALMNHLVR